MDTQHNAFKTPSEGYSKLGLQVESSTEKEIDGIAHLLAEPQRETYSTPMAGSTREQYHGDKQQHSKQPTYNSDPE